MADESKKTLSRVRVDHVGSLLRPQRLIEAFLRRGQGKIGDDELKRVQDEAIREVIGNQETHGLPVVNDGEFRRVTFQDSFSEAVGGFAGLKNTVQSQIGRADPGAPAQPDALRGRSGVNRRLALVRNNILEEYLFARSIASKPVKITLLSPDRVSQRFAYEKSSSVYSGMDEFMDDVVAIERRMIEQLVEAGCRYIQIDAPSYTAYLDPRLRREMEERGEDPEANLARSIKADNAVIAGFPEVTFAVHICRGNRPGGERREGSYDAIAERLFQSFNHDRFLLEYDSKRAGGFEPLRFVPGGKVAVLGLVTTKEGRLETLDDLKRRIEAASRFLTLDQLALSPQCGFSGGAGYHMMSEEEQWRKIDRIVEVAAAVWGE